MNLQKIDFSFLLTRPFLIICLLCAGVDVALFLNLYKQADLLASAHITSFLSASAIGFFAFSRFNQQGLTLKQSATFILLTFLTLFLHGGLLASLLKILAMPASVAIFITAIFSAITLFYAYSFAQKSVSKSALYLAAVAYIILLKLFYLGVPELLFEEAYYWNYAQHLDIGYLDHPLIVAWTIKAFTSLFGNVEFAVRLGAFLYWFVTAYFTFKLTREIFNKTIAYCALVIVAILPAYFSFGWFMTPDAPLTACWAAAIYYTYQSLIKYDKNAWLKLGIALGLGMSSKYTIALLAAAIVLFLMFDKTARKWLMRREPYLAALVALVLFSPVIIWNIQHDWLSFTFQSAGRLESGNHFSLPRFISNLLITLTPIGLLSVVALIFSHEYFLIKIKAINHTTKNFGKSHSDIGKYANRQYLLLMWLSLFPVAIYAVLSLFKASKLNWTGPCWLALIPFLALLVTQKPSISTPKLLAWSQRAWPTTIVFLLLIYGAGMHYLGIGFPNIPYPQNTHLLGFQSLSREIENIKAQMEKDSSKASGEDILVVGMDRNKIASGLAFYGAKNLANNPAFSTASEHLFGDVGLMYELWFPIAKQEGKSMLLVAENVSDLSSEAVISRVKTMGEIKEITAQKDGKTTGHYYYRLVTGYHSH